MTDVAASTLGASAQEVVPRRRVWPPVVLALGCAAAYALFFVVPYYVNDMDRFPLDEVAAGYHDSRVLWPYDTAYAGVVGMGAYLMVLMGVLFVLTALVWSLVLLVRHRASLGWPRRVALLLAVTVALGTLAWRMSTFGQALIRWWLD